MFVQSVNGAGGQGEGHDGGPERSAHQEETLLQVNSTLGYSHNTEIILGLETQKEIMSFWTRNRPQCLPLFKKKMINMIRPT